MKAESDSDIENPTGGPTEAVACASADGLAGGERGLELARKAFKEFYAQCFWSYREDTEITEAKIPFVIRGLRELGGLLAWSCWCWGSPEGQPLKTSVFRWRGWDSSSGITDSPLWAAAEMSHG